MAQNRTINFYGYAYGSTPVSLTANINGVTVFSGPVNTVDQVLPEPVANITNAPVLFSATDSALFPTDFGGAYPMTIEVTGGNGIAIQDTYCNFMNERVILVQASDSTISGTTLTLGNVIAGNINNVYIANVSANILGAPVFGPGVSANTSVTALSTDGTTLQITPSQTVDSALITINSATRITSGNAESFVDCYSGVPSNSEGTPDSRSSVKIDGVDQVPPNPTSLGQWTWIVPTGSTLSCAFSVSNANAWL